MTRIESLAVGYCLSERDYWLVDGMEPLEPGQACVLWDRGSGAASANEAYAIRCDMIDVSVKVESGCEDEVRYMEHDIAPYIVSGGPAVLDIVRRNGACTHAIVSWTDGVSTVVSAFMFLSDRVLKIDVWMGVKDSIFADINSVTVYLKALVSYLSSQCCGETS